MSVMNASVSVRLDKWLWAVRLYKTRSLATAACREGRVTIGGQNAKPARDVKVNDLVQAKIGDLTRTFKVLALLEKRVGAAVVKQFAEDLTPAAEYEKRRESALQPLFRRPKGAGRPTKKERRSMEEFGGLF
jgi:ribosome-associated heat shock protein Hsp15